MISQGSVAAFYRAQTDKDIAPPAELKPTNAVKQYLDKSKRDSRARHPITQRLIAAFTQIEGRARSKFDLAIRRRCSLAFVEYYPLPNQS